MSEAPSSTDRELASDVAHPDICVVTHPLGAAGENATRTLLEILGAITSVSLVTANLPSDSAIRNRHEVVELTRKGAGQSNVFVAAVRFIINQIRMCRVIGRRDEDVVLFFGATAYLLPIVWTKTLGKTVVLEPRGNVPLTLQLAWEQQFPDIIARLLGGAVWSLERLGYWLADDIIAYTPGMAEELGLDSFAEKLHMNGARYVDTERFAPQVPFEERKNVVGFLGRLDEEKNVRILAAAAQELSTDVTFRFIGDGDLREELERELAEEVAAGQVEFTGWIDHDEVPEELSELRLLVLPSEPTEGLPTVILESMACGTPVLATPVAGVSDIVEERKTGFLVTAPGEVRLAHEIECVLDREDLPHISESARSLIEIKYSFEAAVRRYEKLLRSIG